MHILSLYTGIPYHRAKFRNEKCRENT
jgi:hypothetical protein